MLKYNQFIINILKRLGNILSLLKYNNIIVWPVTYQSIFTIDLTSNNSIINICLTQSSPGGVIVTMDDGTTMQSDQINAEFTHQFSNSGTHTIIVEALEGETWYPGIHSESNSKTFLGASLSQPDIDNTLKTISFGYGVRLGENTWDTRNGYAAFQNCRGLTSVDFSKSDMTIITSMVFCDCISFSNINWGNIQEIGFKAFCNCGFTELHLPATIRKLEYCSFDNISSLRRLEVAAKCLAPAAISQCENVEYIWIRNSCLELQAGQPEFDNDIVQWPNCNPDAIFCCEAQTKPKNWGNQFNAYYKNNNIFLRYDVHWYIKTAPWKIPPQQNIPIALNYDFIDGQLEFYEIDDRCHTCGGTGIEITTEICPHCSGSGIETLQEDCPTCGGTGEIEEGQSCPTCGGFGEISVEQTCEECNGSGEIETEITCIECNGSGIGHYGAFEEYDFETLNRILEIFNSNHDKGGE